MTKRKNIDNKSIQIPKTILATAKLLEMISPKLATRFAAKLFITPIKYKIPKREIHMEQKSIQSKLFIHSIKKNIVIYNYGKSEKKILLVHGWSGRGTQLAKIADQMLALGYSTISFDAPAHGKSEGKTTIMTEFIASILEIENKFGPFEFAIGHSLGGMAILNAIKENLNIKKAVLIGSGDIIQDIIDDFINKLHLKPRIGIMLKNHFEKNYNEPMENYAASFAAKSVNIPVLVIHDKNDLDVSVKAAHNIHGNLKKSDLLLTEGLGHRKILGDNKVIKEIEKFICK